MVAQVVATLHQVEGNAGQVDAGTAVHGQSAIGTERS